MRLIVDSNEIISALIKEGMARTIITSDRIEFYSLEYVMDEIKKHMRYIVQKSGMNKREVELLFRLFIQNILLIPEEDIKLKMNEAVKIMKDIDINDSSILACALAVTNDGIWSEDKHLEKQNQSLENQISVKIYLKSRTKKFLSTINYLHMVLNLHHLHKPDGLGENFSLLTIFPICFMVSCFNSSNSCSVRAEHISLLNLRKCQINRTFLIYGYLSLSPIAYNASCLSFWKSSLDGNLEHVL